MKLPDLSLSPPESTAEMSVFPIDSTTSFQIFLSSDLSCRYRYDPSLHGPFFDCFFSRQILIVTVLHHFSFSLVSPQYSPFLASLFSSLY